MNIVVTGASGFLGKALTGFLQQNGYPNITPVSRQAGIDILDWEKLDQAVPAADVVIHLAARSFVPDSYKEPRDFYTTNVTGTLHALELCRKHQARLVYLSSYVYGTPQYLPIDERHPVVAFNPYAQSKIMGEDLCRAYARDFGVQSVILRLFNMYGPGQNDNFLIPLILSQAASGKVQLKDSRPRRDFIYLDDVLRIIEKSMTAALEEKTETVNVGSGQSHSLQEVLELVNAAYQNSLAVTFTEERRPNEVLETVSDIRKAQRLFGWNPAISLQEGLRRMINANTSL